ncbi:hypothetical protein TNCV_1697731 [Trichonephila clavipes]|nr:hypothetical protein TNCV_1697731 [Trichonephila clavipes]
MNQQPQKPLSAMITSLSKGSEDADKTVRYVVAFFEATNFAESHPELAIRQLFHFSQQLSEFWDLENLGIEAEVSDEENIDNDIMSEFEAEFHTKISGIKLNSLKPNMKTLLENNEEIARKRFLKLRSRFKNDSSLLRITN